jgi:membrane protein implicated in regulation of membrane protease activity
MTRRSKWLIGGWVFAVINGPGAVFAAVSGEWLHAATHVVLLVVGVYVWRRFAPRVGRQQDVSALQADARIENLQQSVDAMALQVERIGEAQRYIAKLVAERAEASPPKPHP